LEKILTSEWIKHHSKDSLTASMYDLCGDGLTNKLTQQSSLEEILRQELAWTLEQIGEEEEENEQGQEQPAESFTNQAFKADDEN